MAAACGLSCVLKAVSMVFDGWFPFSQNRERLLAVFFVFGQIRTATDTCGLSRLVKAVSVVVDGSFSVSRSRSVSVSVVFRFVKTAR